MSAGKRDLYKTLAFNAPLIPWIESGKKTATTRIGKRRFSIGECVYYTQAKSAVPLGLLQITGIQYQHFNELDDELARSENYSSAQELKDELLKIYGERAQREIFSVIRFTVIERSDETQKVEESSDQGSQD